MLPLGFKRVSSIFRDVPLYGFVCKFVGLRTFLGVKLLFQFLV
jgi:hypothetical protein